MTSNHTGRARRAGLAALAVAFALAFAVAVAFTAASSAAAAASSAAASPAPAAPHVYRMTYRPGVHLPRPHLPRAVPAGGALQTSNWSGWAAVACRSCSLRYVAATWTVPAVNCAASPDGAYVATWAGLDGITGATVEQTGVDGYCSAGAAAYYGWTEFYPLAPVAYSGIGPGDSITASVYYDQTARQWRLTLADNTTGGSVWLQSSCPAGSACANSSAEVITEAPGTPTLPLADYGTAGYQTVQVTSRNGTRGAMATNGVWSAEAVVMLGASGRVLSDPGPAYAGRAFLTTWHGAQ